MSNLWHHTWPQSEALIINEHAITHKYYSGHDSKHGANCVDPLPPTSSKDRRRSSNDSNEKQFLTLKKANRIGNIQQSTFDNRQYHYGIKNNELRDPERSKKAAKKYTAVNAKHIYEKSISCHSNRSSTGENNFYFEKAHPSSLSRVLTPVPSTKK